MAILADNDRIAVWRAVMEELSRSRTPLGALTKTELRAAVDAADQWVSDNSASFNLALPQPARGVLTASMKAQLLAAVIEKRYLSGV